MFESTVNMNWFSEGFFPPDKPLVSSDKPLAVFWTQTIFGTCSWMYVLKTCEKLLYVGGNPTVFFLKEIASLNSEDMVILENLHFWCIFGQNVDLDTPRDSQELLCRLSVGSQQAVRRLSEAKSASKALKQLWKQEVDAPLQPNAKVAL